MIEHLHAYRSYVGIFGEMSIQIPCPFFNWVMSFFIIKCNHHFYILDYKSLLDILLAKLFTYCLFIFLIISLKTKIFNFGIIYLFYSFMFLVLYLRNHCIIQGHEDLLCIFSYKICIVLVVTFT